MIDICVSESTNRYYKNRYHEAKERSKEAGNKYNAYTMEMLLALRDMAVCGVYPDGTFGDEECNVWSLFRRNYLEMEGA